MNIQMSGHIRMQLALLGETLNFLNDTIGVC